MKIKKKRKYVKSTRNTTLLVYWNPVYSTPFPQKQSKSWLMWQLFLPFSLQYYLLCMFVHISKIHRSFHGCFILLENEISFIFSWISHSCSLQVLVSRLCSSHKMSQVFLFTSVNSTNIWILISSIHCSKLFHGWNYSNFRRTC